MNNKYEISKNSTISLWVVNCSLVFWLISFLPHSFDVGLLLIVIFIIFGGGLSFHFFTELLGAPANEENWNKWGLLAIQLIIAAFSILAVFGVVYFEKQVYSFGGLLSLVAIFITMLRLVRHAEKAHYILYEIIR